MSMMSPRNRRSFFPNRSISSPPPLSTPSYQSKSAAASPVVTVRVAPSQPFSPFRSTIQEPSSQSSASHLHGMQQSTTNGGSVNLPSRKMTSGVCVSRGNELHQGGTSGCVKQSETGDKIDPKRVLEVLQELSRSRKRTRERERGRRLMGDCRERGGNVVAGNGISSVNMST